jgi:hypothetical protein
MGLLVRKETDRVLKVRLLHIELNVSKGSGTIEVLGAFSM